MHHRSLQCTEKNTCIRLQNMHLICLSHVFNSVQSHLSSLFPNNWMYGLNLSWFPAQSIHILSNIEYIPLITSVICINQKSPSVNLPGLSLVPGRSQRSGGSCQSTDRCSNVCSFLPSICQMLHRVPFQYIPPVIDCTPSVGQEEDSVSNLQPRPKTITPNETGLLTLINQHKTFH